MPLKTLETDGDYLESLKKFEEIFQAKHGSDASDEADALALLIKEYEDKHYIIEAPRAHEK